MSAYASGPYFPIMGVNLGLSEGGVRLREFIRELIETVLLSLAVFLALHLSVQNFRVEGSSMIPTLTEASTSSPTR